MTPDALAHPHWFGPYLLIEKLGKGGMAEIWRARASDGGTVVVKRMLPETVDSDEMRAMFRSEARLSARFNHPGIVRVFETGEYHGEPYLTMELVAGRNLNQVMARLAERGVPNPGFGVYVVRELCRALAYVHSITDERGGSMQVLHRDVSPANVMIGLDGSVKLLDFGIAKSLGDWSRPRTEIGVVKGKVSYLSPEAVEGKDVDHRADQWSAGIVLHETLTARRLFRGANDLETLEQVMTASIAPPSRLNADVPAALDRICLRALSRRRDDRFASCRHLGLELDHAAEIFGFGAAHLAQLMRDLFPEQPAAPDPSPTEVPTRVESGMRWGGAHRRASRVSITAGMVLLVASGAIVGWRAAVAPRAPRVFSAVAAAVISQSSRSTVPSNASTLESRFHGAMPPSLKTVPPSETVPSTAAPAASVRPTRARKPIRPRDHPSPSSGRIALEDVFSL